MRKNIITIAAVTALLVPVVALATPQPKFYVCKYVGKPGVDERLQTGNNPISVSGNAITPPVTVGAYFADKQGRSLVVAEDTGQAEPDCPTPENPNPEEPPKEQEPKENPKTPEQPKQTTSPAPTPVVVPESEPALTEAPLK